MPGQVTVQQQLQSALSHHRAGRLREAEVLYRKILAQQPKHADAMHLLGVIAHHVGRDDMAVDLIGQTIALRPGYAEAYNNLGNALQSKGQLDEAIAAYRRAIALNPKLPGAHSNLIYTLHLHPAYDAQSIAEEHRRWNRQHAEPLGKFVQPHNNNRDPERQLRVGYVSADFREHPVGRFLVPLLGAHDADRFAVFCYSHVSRPDGYTELLRSRAHQWRDTIGLTDEQAAQLIREDKIDILMDLGMHTAGNRLLVFARKPAPVQVTYLAYTSTTGLKTMDYRLTDPHLDPAGMDDAIYSERSVRLPETYWCYPLDEQTPEVSPLPAQCAGKVTFGCLNSFCKVSSAAWELWTQLLRAAPNSHLIVHAHEGSHRDRLWNLLERQEIDPHRLKFVGKVSFHEYFKLYHQIDIGLDPFPCNGGTTTCDALWMGVPIVTLAGRTAVGRGGMSVLRNVGLAELIAETPQQYVQIAAGLANDLTRLAELRRTTRQRMRASPLMDAGRFARNIEAAYRQMWHTYCEAFPR